MSVGKLQKIAIVLLSVLLVLALAFCSYYRKTLTAVESGSANGFVLTGLYNDLSVSETADGVESASFQVQNENSDTGIWQVQKGDGELIDGSFKGTYDPNLYRLYDQDGNEIALAHVTYTGAKGNSTDDGVSIVVMGDSLEFELPKAENGPMFIVNGEQSDLPL